MGGMYKCYLLKLSPAVVQSSIMRIIIIFITKPVISPNLLLAHTVCDVVHLGLLKRLFTSEAETKRRETSSKLKCGSSQQVVHFISVYTCSKK